MARKICKEIKLNENEMEIIRKCAKNRGKRVGTYIREISVDGEIKVYDLSRFDSIVMSFNRIGNEMNPIAEVVNSTKEIAKKDIEDLEKSMEYLKAVSENFFLPLEFDFFNNE
ncbi:MAG: hypothetical protein NC320_06185 [Clostridium sp.]|nr:hypothetical protein [Clostridium sp.]